jgi:hypothetical protein
MKSHFPVSTVLVLGAVSVFLIASGCINTQATEKVSLTPSPTADLTPSAPSSPSSGPADRIEVFHFHPTQQCYSCKTLGAYAEKTINESFSGEVESGRLIFRHVNIYLPENAELVKKYGVTGSSLWIGVYNASGFSKEENVNVWYKIDDETEYKIYLKGVIEKRLNGT